MGDTGSIRVWLDTLDFIRGHVTVFDYVSSWEMLFQLSTEDLVYMGLPPEIASIFQAHSQAKQKEHIIEWFESLPKLKGFASKFERINTWRELYQFVEEDLANLGIGRRAIPLILLEIRRRESEITERLFLRQK